jgi:hypothetical protein
LSPGGKPLCGLHNIGETGGITGRSTSSRYRTEKRHPGLTRTHTPPGWAFRLRRYADTSEALVPTMRACANHASFAAIPQQRGSSKPPDERWKRFFGPFETAKSSYVRVRKIVPSRSTLRLN